MGVAEATAAATPLHAVVLTCASQNRFVSHSLFIGNKYYFIFGMTARGVGEIGGGGGGGGGGGEEKERGGGVAALSYSGEKV